MGETMTDLPSLISRLEAATCGDREIDCAIHEIFSLLRVTPYNTWDRGENGEYYTPSKATPGGYVFDRAGHYTTDLNAALSFVERVLPDWRVHNISERRYATARERWGVCLWRTFGSDEADEAVWQESHCWRSENLSRADAPSLALALTLAAVKAVQAKQAEKEGA